MKKLISYTFILVSLLSTSAFANENQSTNSSESNSILLLNRGPHWPVFREVMNAYFNSTGKFLTLSENQKAEFYTATQAMKNHLAESQRPDSESILNKVILTEAVFRFIWESKIEFSEADLTIVPPVLI